MKLYRLSCPQCGWQAKRLVEEAVKNRFINEVGSCRECEFHKRPRCNYVALEVIIVTRKG